MKEVLEIKILEVLKSLSIGKVDFTMEHPTDMDHGDYACNVAMMAAKNEGGSPRELAEKIKGELEGKLDEVEKIEIAGPGFINFYLKPEFFIQNLKLIDKDYGKNKSLSGKKVMIEYTDPNAFKPFHIGHLMSNAIGESLSRLYEKNGAEVKRVNYYSDVGLGIAKAVWGMKKLQDEMPADNASVAERTSFLGKAYALGISESKDNENVESEAREINKKIYDKSDTEINELYEKGRRWSLEHFEELYKRLGSNFDFFVPESEVAEPAVRIVKEWLEKGVFVESDGAIVFEAEKLDPKLHTRVFITKDGLPTYEAKDLALIIHKEGLYKADNSVIITANEQNEYFKVVLRAVQEINGDVEEKTVHLGHGMMRLPEGKMSSRTGNVILGEDLINSVKEKVIERTEDKNDEIAEQVAIGAIKYSILKQAPGKDAIFDFEKSLSFEGNSGPYLQYTRARSLSLLEKGKETGLSPKFAGDASVGETEKLLQRFPEFVESAMTENAPQHIVTYLTELASSFNAFYAQNKIIDSDNKEVSEHRLAIAEAVAQVLENGLWVLGIEAPQKM